MQRTNIFRAAIFLTTLLLPGLLSGQTKTQLTHDCGDGVKLRLSSSAGLQGSLLQFEVISAAPVAALQADWSGHAIPFWPDAVRKNIHHALLGIDLEQKPEPGNLRVSVGLQDGHELSSPLPSPSKPAASPRNI